MSITTSGQAVCSFPGCERPMAYLGRWCKGHYEQRRTGRPLSRIRDHVTRGTRSGCSFPGCERPHSSRGYCGAHYAQARKGKQLQPIRSWVHQSQWGATCRYGTCTEPTHSRGLCIVHYGRGISAFARDAILELQGGRCPCGATPTGGRAFHLDHSHDCPDSTHKPGNYCPDCARGMLCEACNVKGVAWYELYYRVQPHNPPIPFFEQWINRRLDFHGSPDSAGVRVTLRASSTGSDPSREPDA